MQTVGEMLQKARQKQGIELQSIAEQTRISVKYLIAIEKNDFKSLPPATFTKGFMQNYAQVVGLSPKTVLAIFRRDYDQDKQGRIIPRGLSQTVKPTLSVFTPTTSAIAIASTISIIVLAFFIRQIIIFTSAPSIEINHPPTQSTVSSPLIITGSTSANATLTINNRPVSVDQQGDFSSQVELSPGDHTVIITATSRSDRQTTHHLPLTVVQ